MGLLTTTLNWIRELLAWGADHLVAFALITMTSYFAFGLKRRHDLRAEYIRALEFRVKYSGGDRLVQARWSAWLSNFDPRECSNPPCHSLRWLSALIPGPKLRKRVRKMLADQDREIAALKKCKRTGSAAWLHIWTWAIFFFMVFTGPAVSVRNMLFSRRSA